jgi:hypothetical protein
MTAGAVSSGAMDASFSHFVYTSTQKMNSINTHKDMNRNIHLLLVLCLLTQLADRPSEASPRINDLAKWVARPSRPSPIPEAQTWPVPLLI